MNNYIEFPTGDFIECLKEYESKKQKGGVVSLEDRDSSTRLKEIKEYQEENEEVTPEDDIKNLGE